MTKRTPLGKARKQIKELKTKLEAVNAALEGFHNERIQQRALTCLQGDKATRFALEDVKLGQIGDITQREMAVALVNLLRPNKAPFYIILQTLRAAYKMQILGDLALADHRAGRSVTRRNNVKN